MIEFFPFLIHSFHKAVGTYWCVLSKKKLIQYKVWLAVTAGQQWQTVNVDTHTRTNNTQQCNEAAITHRWDRHTNESRGNITHSLFNETSWNYGCISLNRFGSLVIISSTMCTYLMVEIEQTLFCSYHICYISL